MTEHELPDEGASAEAPPVCPKCVGAMWDNRAGKRNPRAPDYKCKTDGCDGVIWPPREAGAVPTAKHAGTPEDPACPVCGGRMWDDRLSKRNPRAPDFRCRNRPKAKGAPGCEGVIWPPRDGARTSAPSSRGSGGAQGGASSRGRGAAAPAAPTRAGARPVPPPPAAAEREFTDDEVPDFGPGDDDLPF